MMERTKNLENFLTTENSTSRNRLQILRYYSQEFLKKGSVVFIVISLLERHVLMVGLARIFMASRSIASEKELFCAISRQRIRKRRFKIITDLDMGILKIVQTMGVSNSRRIDNYADYASA